MSDEHEHEHEHDLVVVGNGSIACAIALRFALTYPDARVAIVGPAPRPGAASLAAGAMLGVFGEIGQGSLATAADRAKLAAALAATELWPAHLEQLSALLVDTAPVRVQPGTYIVSRSEAEHDDAAEADAAAEADLDSRADSEAELDSDSVSDPDHVSDRDPDPVSDRDRDRDSISDPDPVSDRDPDPDFRAVLAALARTGTAFTEVSPRDLPALAPAPRHAPRRAVFVPGEGAIATRHLHRAYDEAFARLRNVTAVDAEVLALHPSGDPRRATTAVALSTQARLLARHVVLAAGAATQRLVEALALADRVPRLVHGVGVALVLDSPVALPRQVVRTPNRGLAGGLYAVPYPAPFAYLGATTSLRRTAEPRASAGAIHGLLHAAMLHLHHGLAGAHVHKVLVGSRPTPLDTYPLLGQTSIPGVWLATGTKRDGLHLSPKLAAELVAALGGGPPPLGGVFAPERPLILPRADRDLAIARAAALRLRANRDRARRAPLPPAALDGEAQRAAVAAIYARCTAAGLVAADRGIPVELLELFDELARERAGEPASAPP